MGSRSYSRSELGIILTVSLDLIFNTDMHNNTHIIGCTDVYVRMWKCGTAIHYKNQNQENSCNQVVVIRGKKLVSKNRTPGTGRCIRTTRKTCLAMSLSRSTTIACLQQVSTVCPAYVLNELWSLTTRIQSLSPLRSCRKIKEYF